MFLCFIIYDSVSNLFLYLLSLHLNPIVSLYLVYFYFQNAIYASPHLYFSTRFPFSLCCQTLFIAYLCTLSTLFRSFRPLPSALFFPPPNFTSIFTYQANPPCPSLYFLSICLSLYFCPCSIFNSPSTLFLDSLFLFPPF